MAKENHGWLRKDEKYDIANTILNLRMFQASKVALWNMLLINWCGLLWHGL